jgi:hypothetical protein
MPWTDTRSSLPSRNWPASTGWMNRSSAHKRHDEPHQPDDPARHGPRRGRTWLGLLPPPTSRKSLTGQLLFDHSLKPRYGS